MAFLRCMPKGGSGGGGYDLRYLKNISSRTGTSTTVNFDLSAYLDDYASLESDNIICEFTSTWARSATASQNLQLSYSYNPSTGLYSVTSNNTFGGSKVHAANFLIVKPSISTVPSTTGIV